MLAAGAVGGGVDARGLRLLVGLVLGARARVLLVAVVDLELAMTFPSTRKQLPANG
jgi:hypothetical protein